MFRLDLLLLQLERMDALPRVADGRENGRKLTAMLIRGFAESHGVHAMFRNAINRLTRRVVETHPPNRGTLHRGINRE